MNQTTIKNLIGAALFSAVASASKVECCTIYSKTHMKGDSYQLCYDGGNEYADLVRNLTGIYKQTKVAVPGNQMFVKYETSSNVARKGFRAFIQKIGKK